MKYFKKFMPLMLALVLVLSQATQALACTGVYVGSGVSENGSTYMGRSEDIGDLYTKIYGVAESKTIADGEIYKDTYGFVMDYDAINFDYPEQTYKYTYVKDSVKYGETMTDANGNPVCEAYAEAGQNEKGVSMSATVSTSYNNEAKTADKLVSTGICEISMTSIVLGGAATAKEGVQLLATIIDIYGAGECNSIMISDPNETWYMEIVSGHQYAAIKMPKDKVSVQPNIMLLGVIDITDTENVIASPDLVKLAEDKGFLETDSDGKINVAKTYAKENAGAGQYSRYWQGLNYVNPTAADLVKDTVMSTDMGTDPLGLLIDPVYKLSTLDVLKLLAYRGEGTVMDSNTTSYTAVGNNRQSECHIFETREGMPAELATIQWQAMADAEFSIYLPYYSALITDVHEGYDKDNLIAKTSLGYRNYTANLDDESLAAVKDSINANFQIINNICDKNRDLCADNLKVYFEDWQESLIQKQAEIDAKMLEIYAFDKELAAEKATALGKDLAQQTLDMTNSVLKELVDHVKSGSTEKFVPSAMTLNVMPVYSFDNIGGTGLPVDDNINDDNNNDDQQPDTGNTGNDENKDDQQTNASGSETTNTVPNTGDASNLMIYMVLAIMVAGAMIVLKKKVE